MSPDLVMIVNDFAEAMKSVDSHRPQAIGRRGRVYKPGIGPFSEEKAVRLIVSELQEKYPAAYRTLRTRVPYPGSRQTCDLVIGGLPDWAVEVKMARPSGDNGKPDPGWTKDVISPYDEDRSAVADVRKLARSGFSGGKAILIYGFDDDRCRLETIVEAFEVLAKTRAALGIRHEALFNGLVHPVHRSGRVVAWEVTGRNEPHAEPRDRSTVDLCESSLPL